MEKICGKKYQQLSKDEMSAVNGGAWRVTEVKYTVTPDRKQLATSVTRQKYFLGIKIGEPVTEPGINDGSGCDIVEIQQQSN